MKGLPKTKRCNSVAVTVSVRIRCICETALTIQIVPCHCIKFVVFIVALGIVLQKSVVNSIVLVKKRTIVSLDNPLLAFMITKFIQRIWLCIVQILLKLPVVFSEIRPPKQKKIKSKSCTFSVRFRHICESAHRV